MNGNDTIESLTAAYLEGRLSPEEAERLLETIERDEQARRTLFEMKNLYDMGRINPLDQRQIEAGWERLVRQTSIRSGENRTAGRTSDRTPLRRMARTEPPDTTKWPPKRKTIRKSFFRTGPGSR